MKSTGFPPDGCQDEQVYAQFCSPLFWALQALVNASIVNGDTGLINEAALYLLSIFRAIKKTEDAVDAHQTPKLLILAEIGISIVNELNHNVISSSLAPKQISLPSSLYRISVVKKCDEASLKCLTNFSVDESFVKRVVHILKSQISGTATTTLSKRRRKGQEITIQSSDVEHNTSNPASQKIASLSLTGTREKQKTAAKEIGLGCRQKRALSPNDSESVVLQNERSGIVMHKDDASKRSKSILEKKQRLSSRASATTKPLKLESHVSSVDRIIPSLKENAEASKSITPSNYPRAELKEPHSLRISYNSGDLICLDSENHETMSDNSSLQKETLLTKVSNTFHPIHCSQRETCSAFGDGTVKLTKSLASMESGRFCERVTSFPAKGKKGQKVLLDISASEIIDENEDCIARRTRRQKV